MKKVITILITFSLVLSLSVCAFAADESDPVHTTRTEKSPTFFQDTFAADESDPVHTTHTEGDTMFSLYMQEEQYWVMNVYSSLLDDSMLALAQGLKNNAYMKGVLYSLDETALNLWDLYKSEVSSDGVLVVNIFCGDNKTTLIASFINGYKTFDLFYDVR